VNVVVVDSVTPAFREILPPGTTLERIVAGNSFGEGPVWRADEHCLLWTDAFEDRILKWQPGHGVSTYLAPTGRALALTLDAQHRLVVSGWSARTVWRQEHDGRLVVLASHFQGQRINTPNDIVVKSDNAIYWTDSSSALDSPNFPGDDCQKYLEFNAVFRIAADGQSIQPVMDDFETPNGLAFSPDESLLYVNDTRKRHIRAFDVQTDGSLRNGRVFYVDRGTDPGNPDGMKVDVAGNVYCTASGGVHVISPQGELLGRIRLPTVSNLAWGDDDWRTLYVTGRSEVYRLRLTIPGVPVPAPRRAR
jgi:gluconolactonase